MTRCMARMPHQLVRHLSTDAHIAQQVEHFLGKEEVIGSNPIVSTIAAEGRGVKAQK